MKWKKRLKPCHAEGDKRTVLRFALWPTLVDTDDEVASVVWLETYYVMQTVVSGVYGGIAWRTMYRYSKDSAQVPF